MVKQKHGKKRVGNHIKRNLRPTLRGRIGGDGHKRMEKAAGKRMDRTDCIVAAEPSPKMRWVGAHHFDATVKDVKAAVLGVVETIESSDSPR